MPKLYFLLFLSFLPFCSSGQDAIYSANPTPRNVTPSEDIFPMSDKGEIKYMEVVNSDLPAENLYRKSLSFMARAFNSAKDVIQLKDRHTKKVIAKGLVQIDTKPGLYYGPASDLYFTLEIQSKDGRYRYIINDLEFVFGGGARNSPYNLNLYKSMNGAYSKKKWTKAREEMDKKIKNIITAMKNFMSKKNNQNNDW